MHIQININYFIFSNTYKTCMKKLKLIFFFTYKPFSNQLFQTQPLMELKTNSKRKVKKPKVPSKIIPVKRENSSASTLQSDLLTELLKIIVGLITDNKNFGRDTNKSVDVLNDRLRVVETKMTIITCILLWIIFVLIVCVLKIRFF